MDNNDRPTFFGTIYETIMEMKRSMPKKSEIWVTKLVPQFDEDGAPAIFKMDVAKMMDRVHPHGLVTPQATITGADELILIHPLTFQDIVDEVEKLSGMGHDSRQPIYPSVGGIPVFNDVYRREYFRTAVPMMKNPDEFDVMEYEAKVSQYRPQDRF